MLLDKPFKSLYDYLITLLGSFHPEQPEHVLELIDIFALKGDDVVKIYIVLLSSIMVEIKSEMLIFFIIKPTDNI